MTAEVTVASPRSDAGRQRAMLWSGWALTGLTVVFLLLDSVMKLLDLVQVRQAETQIGFPLELDRPIGAVELACLALYATPRTAVLGAILLTGLFGGAVASHLRHGDPLVSHVLFGVYVGVMAWGGLWLRDARLRALLPLRAPEP